MPATKDELFSRLAELNIATQTKDHAPVHTVEEARALRGDIPGGHCKNLFLKDRKGALWLVVAPEDANVDLKSLPARIGAARISFGRADLLLEVLGVEPGAVTPFALINDREVRVNVILDESMMANDLVNYHPLKNDATTSIAPADLVTFIKSCGHDPKIVAVA